MKKISIIIIVTFLMVSNIAFAIDNDLSILDEQLEFLDTAELEKILEETLKENDVLPRFNIKNFIVDLIKGNVSFKLSDILKNLSIVFFKELRVSLGLMAKILVITIISSILTNLQSTFENASVAELANYITYILIAILVISSFSEAMDVARIAIDRMVGFMQVILPILLALLTAASGANTRMLFHPMIIVTVNVDRKSVV